MPMNPELSALFRELEELDEVTETARLIRVCQGILGLLPRDDDPPVWASVNSMLASGLIRDPGSDSTAAVRRAIACCEAALSVFRRPDTSVPWAMTNATLASAYWRWTEGDRAANLERALRHVQLALEAEADGLPPEVLAGLYNDLGALFLDRLTGGYEANIESAIQHLTRALALFEPVKDLPSPFVGPRVGWARAQDNLGRACAGRLRGDPADNARQADACFRQALRVWTREEFPFDFAAVTAHIGDALLHSIHGGRAANIEKTIGCYETAWEVIRSQPRAGWPPNWVRIVPKLGSAYAARLEGSPVANARRAIDFLESAYQDITGPLRSAAVPQAQQRLDEGYIFLELGIAYAHPALRPEPEYGDYLELAIQRLMKAESIFSSESSPSDWATALDRLGDVYADRVRGDRAANLRRAISYYEEALTVRTGEAFPVDHAATLHNLGVVYADLAAALRDPGAPDADGPAPDRGASGAPELVRATVCLAAALTTFRLLSEHARRRTTAWELGKAWAEAGDWGQAASVYVEAAEATDILYAASLLQTGQEAELAHATGLYHEAGYALARASRLQDAVVMLERGQARILSESLARDTADLAVLGRDQSGLAAGYRQAATAMRELEARQREFAGRNAHGSGSGSDPASAAYARQAAAADLADAVQAGTENLNAAFRRIREADRPGFLGRAGWADVCAAASPGQPLAYLAVTLFGGVTLVVDRAPATSPGPDQDHADVHAVFTGEGPRLQQQLWEMIIATGPDHEVTGGYLPSQQRHDAPRFVSSLDGLLALLGEQVIPPLAGRLHQLGASGAVLVPGPPLSLLPLHAARPGPGLAPLLSDLDLSYAPSARVLNAARLAAETRAPQPQSLAGVANPDGSLPFATAELRGAAGHFPPEACHALEGKNATRRDLLEAATEATHIHLACHGEFNPVAPLRSRLWLAAGSELNLQSILIERPFSQARLVVMSACQSAVTQVQRMPAEAVGLPAGVLQAGAAGVIGSLWPVDDLATALLMIRFYENYLGEQQPPAAALGHAQRWLSQVTRQQVLGYCREHPALQQALGADPSTWLPSEETPYEAPLYWAAFIFLGA
jgi:CHAT domain-containing protein/tetratricopeptide (TPR) repeat protein